MSKREFARKLRDMADWCVNAGIKGVLRATADTLDGTDPPALHRLDSNPKLGCVWIVVGQSATHKAHFVVGARTEVQAIDYAKAQCPNAESMNWAGEVLVERHGVIGGMILA
jgi:hypothetical protein